MSEIIPPFPQPFGASSGNPGSPNVNRVDTMPTTTDPINTTTTQMCLKVLLIRTSLNSLIQEEGLMSKMFLYLTKRISRVRKLGEKVNGTFTSKWTCSKVTLDQLLSDQVPRDIVKALGGKGRRKEKISSKEVIFAKADESSSVLAPKITSDSKSELPFGTSKSLISLSDLALNIADLTLDTPEPKKTRPFVKVSHAYVIKKKTEKSPTGPKPCSNKKADSSTEQILLTLMEEVKGFKRNHLFEDCYSKPKCSTCGSTDHLTKEYLEHATVKKTLSKLKARSPLKPLPKKAPMIPKPFI
nr:hypothetical protein [Tanacetum cinerariifolium]